MEIIMSDGNVKSIKTKLFIQLNKSKSAQSITTDALSKSKQVIENTERSKGTNSPNLIQESQIDY